MYLFNLEVKEMMHIEMDGHKYISEVDYLKFVEEKGNLNKLVNQLNENNLKYKEELKEKDEEIERLERIKRHLEKVIEEYQNEEVTWTLKYIFENSETKEQKEFTQNGMIKEDAEELIGMDSDNWIHYSLTKEERPSKDQVIEGLLIRCENNEELIKELEEKNDELEKDLEECYLTR